METNLPVSLSFTEKLPSLPVFCGVAERVYSYMSAEQRTRIYQQWVILNKMRLEETLMFVKKPLTKEVFEQLICFIYDHVAELLIDQNEVTFDEWSDDLEDLVMTSYCWSLLIDPVLEVVKEHGLNLVPGNEWVN